MANRLLRQQGVRGREPFKEIEVAGDHALVYVPNDADAEILRQQTGALALPKMGLADTLGELTPQERGALRDVLVALGYTTAEIRNRLRTTDLSTARLGELLEFARTRRKTPRLDLETGVIVLDGPNRVCNPLPLQFLNAFPTSSITDDFNRANATPPGGIWSGTRIDGGTNNIEVESNQLKGDSSFTNSSTITTIASSADCEARITMATKPGDSGWWEIHVRLKDVGSGTFDSYVIDVTPQAGTDVIEVAEYANAGYTVLGATVNQEVASGDKFGIEAIGSNITGYYDLGGDDTYTAISRTDSTLTAAGYFGFMCRGGTGRFDNWGHGVISGAAPASPRGMLMGVG